MHFFSARAEKRLLPILLITICLAGCASLSGRGKLEGFEKVSKQYRFAVLMSDFEQAARISAVDSPIDFSILKNFHVVSYKAKKIDFSEDKSKVFQAVDIEYYRVDTLLQKNIRDNQEWHYQVKTEQWVLESGLPQFK